MATVAAIVVVTVAELVVVTVVELVVVTVAGLVVVTVGETVGSGSFFRQSLRIERSCFLSFLIFLSALIARLYLNTPNKANVFCNLLAIKSQLLTEGYGCSKVAVKSHTEFKYFSQTAEPKSSSSKVNVSLDLN